ncbi:hypothetical protein Zm00014a_024500 [Zea mays]|uniref:Uncharacterized protein n=1 Tax=Zea mays TaxID=4577 RepID=A0A3L6G4P4_MAIZE|nr:hypothetical protein Zm00014a_024500 [Zea mays]
MINTTDFRASRRSASGSGSSGRSSRRLTEQELEIVRLREENRERDEQLRAQTEQLRAQSEYYASVHAQQQQMIQLLAQQQGIPYVAPPPPPQWTFVPMGPPPPPGLVPQQPQFSTPPAQLPAPGAQVCILTL